MKKPASDQQWHQRRHEERKRAEAARKPVKKIVPPVQTPTPASETAPATCS
jgi:hypothetical protein